MDFILLPVLLTFFTVCFYLFQRFLLIFLYYYLRKKFMIYLSVKSVRFLTLKKINISCSQLGINIKIEHFGFSSKLFNSKYNSLIVFKFSDIRLEGDIVAALKCLTRFKINVEDKSIFHKIISSFLFSKFILLLKRALYPIANFFTSNLQVSLHNTSLMQLGLPNRDSTFNDCLIHSTIQLIQFEFATKSKRQINFQVDGFSIKILKSNNNIVEGDGKSCLAQMSFPFRFQYVITDKSAEISISTIEVIIYDILVLINMFHLNTNQIEESDEVSNYKTFEHRLDFLQRKIFHEDVIKNISFKLNSGSIKLVREFGKKELTLFVKPIELVLNKSDCNILEARISISNFAIQDSESIINFSLNKCITICKMEEERLDKIYLQLFLEISSYSFIINYSLVHSWFQYFVNLFHNIQSRNRIRSLENNPSFFKSASTLISKLVFVMSVNDLSVSLNKSKNLMITYGLKHLKINCIRNFDPCFNEKSTEILMDTFWCWNGHITLKPSNPNSLKRFNEKHVPLFMSTLLLKFSNMNDSEPRINCVMDGLKISIEYFLNEFENIDYFKSDSFNTSSSRINSGIAKYNLLGQINFTSVNLFTSQLMLRFDSMASDLNNSRMTCSINGLAINSMYAPSATLACLKACELTKERIAYISVMRINFGKDTREILFSLSEEIFVSWSPAFHLSVLQLYEDIANVHSRLYFLKSSYTSKSYVSFKNYNLGLKLDGKIVLGVILTNTNDTLRLETEYFTLSCHNGNQFNCKCEHISIFINTVLTCNVENLLVSYLSESKNPLDRKAFKHIEKSKNNAIEVLINKVALTFPYEFNFAEYFNEKFITIVKWLRIHHSNGKVPKYMQEDSKTLMPDFIVKIQEILIELGDDPFEIRLNDNYDLIEDEHNEIETRWTKLMKRIEEIRRKRIISDAQIKELTTSFEIQNAKIYIERSKKIKENQSRTQLFIIKAEDFLIHLISDTSYNAYNKMVKLLKCIDNSSPFPDDLKFSTIWCRQTYCCISQCIVSLRDFPRPMINAKNICFKGILLGAEQEASARAKRTCYIDMGPGFEPFSIERSMTTLKFYHDITSKIEKIVYTHGACWEPILQQVNLSFEKIFRPSTDPSPSLTWWDKMRFLFHGSLNLTANQISIVFHASLDPYNSTELIEIAFLNANTKLVTGKINVQSDLDVFVHTASKYDECRFIHLPDINITFDLNWDCSGNRNDHHSVMQCAADKLPEYSCNQVHDSYRAFRSRHLNLSASIEANDCISEIPSILVYNSTLRWLENKMHMITGFPRLTRRGKLYNNIKPRKMPFTRLFRSIHFMIDLKKLEITYWSSYNQHRGFRIISSNLTHNAEHRQTLIKINDNLIHRPKPQWELIYMNSELSNVEIDLFKGRETDSMNTNPLRSFFLNVQKLSYNRETKLPHIDNDEEQSPIHRLTVHSLKGAWTKDNREIVLSLFDSYFKTQLLKRNLSTEALRLFKDQLSGSPSKNSTSQPNELNPYTFTKGNAANMLQKLISESSNNVVDTEQIENVVNDKIRLYGIEACQTNDVLLNNWLIELINSQVALRGCETDGYVIVSAAKTQITQRIHKPVWKNRVLYSKTTWQGSLECMQYYATVDAGGLRIEDITWLDLNDIEERTNREIEEFPDLVGSGRSVGGVVNSEAGGSSGEPSEPNKVPIQLQRIVSRCRCKFFYASYGENTDPSNYDEVPPLPQDDDLLPLEPWDKEIAVDTFTLTHEQLEISTNSQQFSMIVDLVNNLLLYVEPHKKEVYDRQQTIRFSMEINSLEDQREPISKLQEKVRSLLNKIRTLEKEAFLLNKKNSSDVDVSKRNSIEAELAVCKKNLNIESDNLSNMINCYKEVQLIASKTKERQVAAQESRMPFMAQVIRRNEVCFKQACWRLTDADGQLGLADLELNNFLYIKVCKNDDSVEHLFELGYIRVQNMLPNQAYRDVLQPTELQPNMPVDQHRALRIMCIEKAPVSGIAVKEHLEVNIIPLTLGITYAFFRKMLKFFFNDKGSAGAASATSDTASTISDASMGSETTEDSSSSTTKAGKKKSGMKRDESSVSLTNSLSSYNLRTNSKIAKDLAHIEKMRERASKNQTFVYIKIPEVPIRISYKGNKNKNLEDLHDVSLVIPTIEYHNRTWTWLDLLMEVKNESKRVLVSQALKQKFHISKSKPLSTSDTEKKPNTNPTQSSEDEDKVRILLGNIVVPQKSTKTKSMLLFGNKT